jgi:WD40 repeat protein
MADGELLLGMGTTPQSASIAYVLTQHLISYDPATGVTALRDPGLGGILAVPARSLNGKYLLVEGLGPSGLDLFVYSNASHSYVATSTGVNNGAIFLAANPDGSQFASVEEISGADVTSRITFWTSDLKPGQQYNISAPITSALYSRDGKYLYILQNSSTLVAIDTQAATPAGYLAIHIGSILLPVPSIFDIDEMNRVFGATSGGTFIANASRLQPSAPTTMPEFIGPSTEANPNVGPVAGGNDVQFVPAPSGSGSADGIVDSTEAYFGPTPAPKDTVAPYPASSNAENFLTATAPAATVPGPVTVVLTDTNNNVVFLPDAYTYGPHLLRVGPNSASAAGGDLVTISAYGLGFFASVAEATQAVHVTIGGSPARLTSLNSYASPIYPEQSVTVEVPPGAPGWADITISTSNGSDIIKHGLQYLQRDINVQGGPFGFAVYDSTRDRFYLTGNANTVSVFDPQSGGFLPPLHSSAVSAGAVLESEVLTPDASKLVVADPADQSVVVFDLASGTSSAVTVVFGSESAVMLSAPMSLVATAGNRAFVSLTPCISNPIREIDLTTLTAQVRSNVNASCDNPGTYPQFGEASGDGNVVVFAGNSGFQPPGAEHIWKYDATADAFTGPISVQDTPWLGRMATVNSDGSVIAVSQGVLDQRLLPLVPLQQAALDAHLNGTGSLLCSSYFGIAISDTHNGRSVLTLPVATSSANPYRSLAIDSSGRKILFATDGRVWYFELAVVPLAIGTVTPAQASVGATVRVSGSGFVNGTAMQLNGQPAACVMVDSETLSCTVPAVLPGMAAITLINPDGQTYSSDIGLTIQ